MKRLYTGLALGIFLAVAAVGCNATTATPPHTRTPFPTSTPRPTSPPPTARVVGQYVCADGDGVMLRSDSGCQYKTAAWLKDGTRVGVVSTASSCASVQSPGGTGYVPTQYLCDTPMRPGNSVDWTVARSYVGQVRFVCGLVEGASYRTDVTSQPTWLNIGADYPSPNRVQVVIWGQYRANFPPSPETYYHDNMVCIKGLIEWYNGVIQIEIADPSAVIEW